MQYTFASERIYLQVAAGDLSNRWNPPQQLHCVSPDVIGVNGSPGGERDISRASITGRRPAGVTVQSVPPRQKQNRKRSAETTHLIYTRRVEMSASHTGGGALVGLQRGSRLAY